MSFACPFETDPYCKDDTVVDILRELFGTQYIDAFLQDGVTPALQGDGANTIMAIASSTISSLAITAAIMIVVVSAYKWVTESANDGEAVGLTERTGLLGFFGRPLFSLIMLAPTASGYPLIHIITMTIILWSNGAANTLYYNFVEQKTAHLGGSSGILDNPALKEANSVNKAAAFGALHGYCASVLDRVASTRVLASHEKKNFNSNNEQVTSENSGWIVARSGLDVGQLRPVSTEDVFRFHDYNGQVAASQPLCGSFTVKSYKAEYFYKDALELNNLDASQASVYAALKQTLAQNGEISAEINGLRRAYALKAYYEGFAFAYGRNKIRDTGVLDNMLGEAADDISSIYFIPTNAPQNGWPNTPEDVQNARQNNTVANIQGVLGIGNALSSSLHRQVVRIAQQNDTQARQERTKDLRNALLTSGWVTAGNTQAILRRYAGQSVNGLFTKAYTITADLGLPVENIEKIDSFRDSANTIQTTQNTLLQQINESPSSVQGASDLNVEAALAGLSDGSEDSIQDAAQNMGGNLLRPLLSINEGIIETMVGSRSSKDALTDIQNVGENMIMVSGAVNTAIYGAEAALYLSEWGINAGKSIPLIGTIANIASPKAGETAKVTRQALTDMVLDPISDLLDHVANIGRIFGVIIPSMPYIFLILASIGWFIQILQTMFGMPLWLVMHAIPDKSFVGSQQQGYVTLLALFFRPPLIVTAFFLSFVIYDPVVTLFTEAFFQIQNNVSGASTENWFTESLTFLFSIRYWWYVYGAGLIMITYLIFGLVQELADSVLNWVGTNLLSSFGNLETSGVMRGATANMAKGDADKQKRAAERKDKFARNKLAAKEQKEGAKDKDGQNDTSSPNSIVENDSQDGDERTSVTSGQRDSVADITPSNELQDENTDGQDISDAEQSDRQNIMSTGSELSTADSADSSALNDSGIDPQLSGDDSVSSQQLPPDGQDEDSKAPANDDIDGNGESKAFVAALPSGAVKDTVGNSSIAAAKTEDSATKEDIKDSDGKVIGSKATNADGTQISSVTNPDGSKTRSVTKPDGSKSSTTIGKDGSVSHSETDAVTGNTTKLESDSKGNFESSVTDANGNSLSHVAHEQHADGSYKETARTATATSVTAGDADGNYQSTMYANDENGNPTDKITGTASSTVGDDGVSTTTQESFADDGSSIVSSTTTQPNKDFETTTTSVNADGSQSVVAQSSRTTDPETGAITRQNTNNATGVSSKQTKFPDGSRESSINSPRGSSEFTESSNGSISGVQKDSSGNVIATTHGTRAPDGTVTSATRNTSDNTETVATTRPDGSSLVSTKDMTATDADGNPVELSNISVTPTANGGAHVQSNDFESGVATTMNSDSSGNYSVTQQGDGMTTQSSGNLSTGQFNANSFNTENPDNKASYSFTPREDGGGTITATGSDGSSFTIEGSKVDGKPLNPMSHSAAGSKALNALAVGAGAAAASSLLSQSTAKADSKAGFDSPAALTTITPNGAQTTGAESSYHDSSMNGATPQTVEGSTNSFIAANVFPPKASGLSNEASTQASSNIAGGASVTGVDGTTQTPNNVGDSSTGTNTTTQASNNVASGSASVDGTAQTPNNVAGGSTGNGVDSTTQTPNNVATGIAGAGVDGTTQTPNNVATGIAGAGVDGTTQTPNNVGGGSTGANTTTQASNNVASVDGTAQSPNNVGGGSTGVNPSAQAPNNAGGGSTGTGAKTGAGVGGLNTGHQVPQSTNSGDNAQQGAAQSPNNAGFGANTTAQTPSNVGGGSTGANTTTQASNNVGGGSTGTGTGTGVGGLNTGHQVPQSTNSGDNAQQGAAQSPNNLGGGSTGVNPSAQAPNNVGGGATGADANTGAGVGSLNSGHQVPQSTNLGGNQQQGTAQAPNVSNSQQAVSPLASFVGFAAGASIASSAQQGQVVSSSPAVNSGGASANSSSTPTSVNPRAQAENIVSSLVNSGKLGDDAKVSFSSTDANTNSSYTVQSDSNGAIYTTTSPIMTQSNVGGSSGGVSAQPRPFLKTKSNPASGAKEASIVLPNTTVAAPSMKMASDNRFNINSGEIAHEGQPSARPNNLTASMAKIAVQQKQREDVVKSITSGARVMQVTPTPATSAPSSHINPAAVVDTNAYSKESYNPSSSAARIYAMLSPSSVAKRFNNTDGGQEEDFLFNNRPNPASSNRGLSSSNNISNNSQASFAETSNIYADDVDNAPAYTPNPTAFSGGLNIPQDKIANLGIEIKPLTDEGDTADNDD